jgi:hypothetical protein
MAGITLVQAQASLDAALAAQTAILEGGVEYRHNDRLLKCPPLAEVQSSIEFWDGQVQRLAAGNGSRGPRVFGVSIG